MSILKGIGLAQGGEVRCSRWFLWKGRAGIYSLGLSPESVLPVLLARLHWVTESLVLVPPLSSALLGDAITFPGLMSPTIWSKSTVLVHICSLSPTDFCTSIGALSRLFFEPSTHSFIKQAFRECLSTTQNSSHQPHYGQTKCLCFISDPATKTWNFSMTDYGALSK